MDLRLTALILLPLGLAATALYVFLLRPFWARTVDRCQTLDAEDAREKALREEAERELYPGDTPQ